MPLGKTSSEVEGFYGHVLELLVDSNIPFMVGGAYAAKKYIGIERATKDLDIFCETKNYPKILSILKKHGFKTKIENPKWIAKIFSGETYVDLIFGSSNGAWTVSKEWFKYAPKQEILGQKVYLVPVEEMIWSKTYVQARDCFHGSDIYHLILAQGKNLDWHRILKRMNKNWPVLLTHLINFSFIYPSKKDLVPRWLKEELFFRYRKELGNAPAKKKICRGRLFSMYDYEIDFKEWGYSEKN